jgi:hypothetical protein
VTTEVPGRMTDCLFYVCHMVFVWREAYGAVKKKEGKVL